MSIELRQNELTMSGGAAVPRAPRKRVVCRWRLLALASLLLLGMAAVAPPAMAQQAQGKHCFVNQRVPIRAYTADTQQYGKWALICSAQPVDNKAVTLGLTVDIVQQNQQKVVQLIVRLPPAAKAGKDIRLVVDQNQPLQAAIGQCNEFGCLVRGLPVGGLILLQCLEPPPHRLQRAAEMRFELLQLLERVTLRLLDDLIRLRLSVLDHLRGMTLRTPQHLMLGRRLLRPLVGARHDARSLGMGLGDDALLLGDGPVRLLDLVR